MLLQNEYHQKLDGLFGSFNRLQFQVEEYKNFPKEVADWLGRLKLLYGVPLNYLVPDERMLPPESIRFFYIDPNWIKALLDGAFSIGRSVTPEKSTRSFRMDSASTPLMSEESRLKATAVRTKYLGLPLLDMDMKLVSGFLLRSSVVADYPGLGVNVYAKEQARQDGTSGAQLNILRMERLIPTTDVLLCIVEGDVYRVDIHEAPEALHYGIDTYYNESGTLVGRKVVYPFSKEDDNSVSMEIGNPQTIKFPFREGDGGRVINMAKLALAIGEQTSPSGASLDASEMGFEMIEGVGMINFYNEKEEQ